MSTTQPRAWGAFSGQPYGSFAGKTATLASEPVRVTQPRAWGAFSGQPYGSFADKTAGLAPVPVKAFPSWYYTPGVIPMDAAPWILRELQAISQSTYGAAPFVQMQAQYQVPAKLHDGMVVRAKSPWDPGAGDGIYYYDDETTAWIKLG